MKSFNEWMKIHESKRMKNTSEPKMSDTEKLRKTGSLEISSGEAKPRIPVGKPASACGIGKKKGYSRQDRRQFKRIED